MDSLRTSLRIEKTCSLISPLCFLDIPYPVHHKTRIDYNYYFPGYNIQFYGAIKNLNQSEVLPRAKGIELILLGGMSPTSVTTAVIYVGGVRSYRGFKFSRFEVEDRSSNFVFF